MYKLIDDNGIIATGSKETLCNILYNWFDGEENVIEELDFFIASNLYNEDEIGNAMHSIRIFKNSDLHYIYILGFEFIGEYND